MQAKYIVYNDKGKIVIKNSKFSSNGQHKLKNSLAWGRSVCHNMVIHNAGKLQANHWC